jgi:hypothetical protein
MLVESDQITLIDPHNIALVSTHVVQPQKVAPSGAMAEPKVSSALRPTPVTVDGN